MLKGFDDEYFMRQALIQASAAMEMDEVPVGAVVVANEQIIARAHNLTEQLTDVTAHAEMQAITAAAQAIGGKYLKGCTLFVTLEPCVMCAGALYWSQIERVVFAAEDEKRGAGTVSQKIYHPKTKVKGGVLANNSQALLSEFFSSKRNK